MLNKIWQFWSNLCCNTLKGRPGLIQQLPEKRHVWTILGFMDLRATFDTVNHDLLTLDTVQESFVS